ncbi:hypothetical protein HYT58_02490 [Candidatus Woesearchaeota archaeon]|nr:hypothetical protein [Candidatus Woesearchaeota archaeon]
MEFEPISKEELIKQGECCGKGCTNCPYEPRNVKGAKKIR